MVEKVARWIATVVAALVCGIAAILPPFGCAVGEYEEDRNCGASGLALAGLGVLVAGIVAARLTHRPAAQWAGVGASVVLALAGAG